MELDVAFLNGSLPPELLPYLVDLEDMILWSCSVVLGVVSGGEAGELRRLCCILKYPDAWLGRRGHHEAL